MCICQSRCDRYRSTGDGYAAASGAPRSENARLSWLGSKISYTPSQTEEPTIRTITKPSTAKCDKDLYTWFLLAESKYAGCTRLAEILGLSHDSVNRFLLRERYEPKDLFDEVKPHINLIGGTLSVDDTVAEKPYSASNSNEFIGYFWSGSEHRPVKGINLITLYYTDLTGQSVPVNYRLYRKEDGKTKNAYFREMVIIGTILGIKTILGDRRLLVFQSRES